MFRPVLIIFFITFIHLTVFSQVHYITGTVKDESGKALPGAEVFLSGTSKITVTNEDGGFIFTRLASGNYELVARMLGHQTYHGKFALSKSAKFQITLNLKSQQLDEVSNRPNLNRQVGYKLFKKYFLGNTPNAQACRILNPEILNIHLDPDSHILEVNSGGGFLEIYNPALGYNIKYLLEDFILDQMKNYSSYNGQTYFQSINGSAADLRKWTTARNEAYLGSSQNLLKSLYHRNVDNDGFLIRKITNIPNRERPADMIIDQKITLFTLQSAKAGMAWKKIADSLYYWKTMSRLPKFNQHLGEDLIPVDSLVSPFDALNKQLKFSGDLYIVYKNEDASKLYTSRKKDMKMFENDFKSQISSILLRGDSALVDGNGNLANPLSLFFKGYMAWEKVGDMLPKDFVCQPEIKKEL